MTRHIIDEKLSNFYLVNNTTSNLEGNNINIYLMRTKLQLGLLERL